MYTFCTQIYIPICKLCKIRDELKCAEINVERGTSLLEDSNFIVTAATTSNLTSFHLCNYLESNQTTHKLNELFLN